MRLRPGGYGELECGLGRAVTVVLVAGFDEGAGDAEVRRVGDDRGDVRGRDGDEVAGGGDEEGAGHLGRFDPRALRGFVDPGTGRPVPRSGARLKSAAILRGCRP